MSRERFSSSSEEDEMETSNGEGEEADGNSSSSSEEEVDETSKKSVLKKRETVLPEKNHASDSESGSEEESDHDSETERKDPVKNPGPSVVKSVAETQDSKKGKSSTKKRSTDGAAAASTDAKRVKRSSGEEKTSGCGEETKKLYFQRVWSEEDEILVLQRIIDYKTQNGVSPIDDINAFYQLMKESISFDVSKTQFTEKLRTLKKKFENKIGKAKNGEAPTFSKPHGRKAFELSKFIWGANGIAPESAVKSNGKSKYVKQETEDEATNKGQVYSSLGGMTELDTTFTKSYLVKSLACFGVDDLAARQGWTRLASEDKKRFEEQWNAMQLKFFTQKSTFINEVVTKMAQAFRPNP